MKKTYIKPELERLLISSVEDILAGGSPETEVGDGDWNVNPDDDKWG